MSTESMENFAALLESTPAGSMDLVGSVVKGFVVALDGDSAIVDVGLKSEGRVSLTEFSIANRPATIKPGDTVDVYIERMENRDGLIVLSHEKAKREAAWLDLEQSFKANQPVKGIIFGRVKGGFTVDLGGAVAFLPGSQLDIRPIKDPTPLMNLEQPFVILKMDRSRGNIVVSRRAIMEESRSEARSELLSTIEEGKILEGVVKNVTDYGAFIDLGGVDGLLHVTDISWKRINHPSEVLHLGQAIKVQVIRYNRDTNRISLGMKQLESDPWGGIEARYPVGNKVRGKITNITDYGAFVELEEGIEGLVHVSEMSWTKKNIHPGKMVSSSQDVEVMVLEVDPQKRRIALGMKQCNENPWKVVAEQYPAGTEFEGEVRNITEFGLFVAVSNELDGMVHMSDLSWEMPAEEAIKTFKRGEKVKVKVLEVDPEKERIALGIKQLQSDPFAAGLSEIKKGDIVTCEVTAITDGGLEVRVGTAALPGFIKKADLAKERADQRPERFAVGEKVDAKVMSIERSTRRVNLSIKGREVQEEKEAVAAYGSTDSGASLGNILGAAFNKVKDQAAEAAAEEPKASKTKKKAE